MAVSVRKAEEAMVVGPRETDVALMEMISFGKTTKFFLGVGLGSGRGWGRTWLKTSASSF